MAQSSRWDFWKGMAQSLRWDFRREYPPIIPLGFWDGMPHNFVEISGGNNPNHLIGISDGKDPNNYVEDGSIIDAMIPFRGSPKARQSFSPTVAASAATLGMDIAEIATLKALHQYAPRIVATDMKSRRIVVRRIKPMHRGDFPHPG
jgi:hypothetical protein